MMKTKDILLAVAALLTFAVVFYACKNPGEGVTININTNVLKSPTAVQFVNAVKNAPNQPDDFPVTIGGKDADKVVTITNKTQFNAVDGRIFLALKKGVVPSEANPVVFTVAAEVAGFTPATKTFRITSEAPSATVVPLIEYANPVPGTTAVVENNPIVGGVTPTVITIETPTNPGMEEQATITIPAGTEFRDAAGNLINATSLESRVVQFGTDSPEALAAFPGGFDVANITGENGQPIEGGVAFITAGFIAMDMYAGGTEVKNFSKPIEVSMGVSPEVTNPETGTVVKAGDQVPVWSLDDKTGQWKYESEATIVKDAQGNLTASFSATHLSYWNLDWYSTFCPNTTTITYSMPGYVTEQYQVELVSSNGYVSYSYPTLTDGAKYVQRLPTGNFKIVVRNPINNVIIVETPSFNGCGGNVTVNFPAKNDLDIVNVAINLQGTCPNKPLNTNIDSHALVYEKGKPRSQGTTVYVKLGKLNLQLKNNTEYVVEAQYGDAWKTANIAFKKQDFSFPGTVSGTATYDQGTNTVNVLAQFRLPDCN
ncbi:hypothetical protein [Pedobacter sp. GR22-6]|uniref:hypothetical protein n=1 Tax=Pedobacter sp. GR22-6 TaxID=3127957 RepID=UPI00307F4DA4